MTTIYYIGAYIFSIVGGWLIAGTSVYVMRISINKPREFFRWLDIWVGGAERAVATTLAIFAPKYLPAFVGGWVALKFAANWKRQTGEGTEQASLVALVGSIISFAVAVAAGLMIQPDAITAWAE